MDSTLPGLTHKAQPAPRPKSINAKAKSTNHQGHRMGSLQRRRLAKAFAAQAVGEETVVTETVGESTVATETVDEKTVVTETVGETDAGVVPPNSENSCVASSVDPCPLTPTKPLDGSDGKHDVEDCGSPILAQKLFHEFFHNSINIPDDDESEEVVFKPLVFGDGIMSKKMRKRLLS